MKTLFFGTPPFAASVLKKLLSRGVNIVAVVSKPDKPQGRSKKLVPTAVKQVAVEEGLPLFQPEKASDPTFVPTLASFEPDLIVVVAYGEIIKENVLSLPHKACINLHASLLPKYRGAAPIQWAIIRGEEMTGVTIIHMAKKMDAGDILAMEGIPIGEEESYGELQERLCLLGGDVLYRVVKEFEEGVPTATVQDHSLATLAPKIELEDCQIDWQRSASELHNLIRGVNPYPGAWCEAVVRGQKKRLKIFSTKVVDTERVQSQKLTFKGDSPIVFCGAGGALQLGDIQLEGKQKMDAAALMRGIGKENFYL